MKIILGAFPFFFGLLVVLHEAKLSESFYWPNMEPVTYCTSSDAININSACKPWVMVFLNRLTSEKSLLPFEYHDFDFCLADERYPPILNAGQELLGDRIKPSPIYIEFKQDAKCTVICKKIYTGGDEDSERRLNRLKEAIRLNYKQHWIVDSIPVVSCRQDAILGEVCTDGFEVGSSKIVTTSNGTNATIYYPNNRLHFEISYNGGAHEDWGIGFGKSIARIVAVKVESEAIRYGYEDVCHNYSPIKTITDAPLEDGKQLTIMYSFSVNFVRDDSLKWSNRWEPINNTFDQNSWFSIFESLVLAFICSLWTWILLRRFSQKEVLEKPPWSLLQSEVYRSPSNAVLLSSLIGCGIQILVTLLVTLIFASVVFQTPDYQGHVLYFAINVFGFLALLAGNISGRFYRRFEGQKWTKTAAVTAAFPGLLISLVIAMDEIFYINKSSGSLTFNSIMFLLTLWLFVAFPLTYLGTFFGFYKLKSESDVAVSEISRVIPDTPILARLIPGIVFGGLLPFLTLYINLPIIQHALSSSNYGILLLILVLEIGICAECTILLCYDHLRVEDYNWWWRSFLTSGFVSFYLFIYCCYELPSYVDMASVILYFGFTIILVLLFFLLTGSVGFLACLWFINRLFGNVDKKVGFYDANLAVAVESPEKNKENLLVNVNM